MIVLTKSQAFLAYKLGLLVGFSTKWQDYVTEFGSVIGSGFVWRQIARQLIGLIPAWGIVPKVAISYSGTYVVGHAILSWYLTGKHLSPMQMRALSRQAFGRGKEIARKLGERFPKPRLGSRKQKQLRRGRKFAELQPGELRTKPPIEIPIPGTAEDSGMVSNEEQMMDPSEPEEKAQELRTKRICKNCGKGSALDAEFCQYCGTRFENQS
jgi:ribosomal protein L40E